MHCLKARHERARDEYQEELAQQNPVWEEMAEEAERTGVRPRTNPDGDVSHHVARTVGCNAAEGYKP